MTADQNPIMDRASVRTSASENSFNAIRLLAALQVAYLHAVAHLHLQPLSIDPWIAQFPGVPIFFAISGYLVFDSLLRLRTLKEFATHRAARIYPALAVNILILELLLYASGQIEFTRSMPALWALLFFICYLLTASYNIAALWIGSGGGTLSFDGFFQIYPSGVLWTLTVELTFYIAVALMLWAKGRATQTCLICIASVASFAFQNYLGADPTRLTVTITVVPYFWIFGIGMLSRLWMPGSWATRSAAALFLAAYLLIAWWRQLAGFEWKIEPSAGDVSQTILLCLTVIAVGLSPLLKSKILARNDVSYGAYLYHMLIVTALMNVPEASRGRWLLLVVIAGALAMGLASWRAVERPALDWVKRHRRPRNSSQQASDSKSFSGI